MKLMIISDIHGIKTNLKKIKEKFKEENCDKILILGDLYYIGPRNKMIEGYDINYVKEFIESFNEKVICMRGNCDSEIDLKVSKFPIIERLGFIKDNENELYFTHGHIYNKDNWDYENTTLIYGHLHIPFIEKIDNNIYINPGSISLPKNNFKPSYLIYDSGEYTIYDIDDKVLFQYKTK